MAQFTDFGILYCCRRRTRRFSGTFQELSKIYFEEFMVRNTHLSTRAFYERGADIFEYTSQNIPKIQFDSIGYHAKQAQTLRFGNGLYTCRWFK